MISSVFIGAIGFGIGAELIRKYRKFKARRREIPYEVRNSGFWTDWKLYRAEALFSAAFAAGPFTGIILLTSADRPIWVLYVGLLAYAFAIYLVMSALNMREPQ